MTSIQELKDEIKECHKEAIDIRASDINYGKIQILNRWLLEKEGISRKRLKRIQK